MSRSEILSWYENEMHSGEITDLQLVKLFSSSDYDHELCVFIRQNGADHFRIRADEIDEHGIVIYTVAEVASSLRVSFDPKNDIDVCSMKII